MSEIIELKEQFNIRLISGLLFFAGAVFIVSTPGKLKICLNAAGIETVTIGLLPTELRDKA